jgi:hypothetical protein
MSALHRLKAYFGMVPAEEFDAAQFGDPAQFGNPAQFNAAHFNAAEFGPVESDEYRSGHRSVELQPTSRESVNTPLSDQ